ncbi:hypothetical protein FNV43_RR18382 [Rhamnella rubrinervis]|uniref:Reverse transcriptase n=1 Tax=Rhamnella rubrinervis TaxID=2594499 RepID=A0A8K0E666_9ROSA|nr:hypothetical protein FNV43_RR18382 [Rhamnella rubrinervis]
MEEIWIQFKYERLTDFCYKCGFLDHVTGRCSRKEPVIVKDSRGRQAKLYGPWMRAENNGTVVFEEKPVMEYCRKDDGEKGEEARISKRRSQEALLFDASSPYLNLKMTKRRWADDRSDKKMAMEEGRLRDEMGASDSLSLSSRRETLGRMKSKEGLVSLLQHLQLDPEDQWATFFEKMAQAHTGTNRNTEGPNAESRLIEEESPSGNEITEHTGTRRIKLVELEDAEVCESGSLERIENQFMREDDEGSISGEKHTNPTGASEGFINLEETPRSFQVGSSEREPRRGLGNLKTVQALGRVIKRHNPSCVFLMETKCNRERVKIVGRKLGYEKEVIVEAKGAAGGLVFFWRGDLNVHCLWDTDRVICLSVWNVDRSKECILIGCHGTPYYKEKKSFWDKMGHLVNSMEKPWMLFGDLNEVLMESEKWGGRSIWSRQRFLKDFLLQVQGIDLGFHGSKYTWNNNIDGLGFIRERLDRAVASPDWILNNPSASVHHLSMEESDHLPILIHTGAWHEGEKPGMTAHKLGRSLWATTRALKKWNRNHFGMANVRIQELEAKLKEIHGEDGNQRDEVIKVKKELDKHRERWESILKKSRVMVA